MPKFKALLTDFAWKDLEIEHQTLDKADVELIVATQTDENTLATLAAEHQVDAIMTNWAKVTSKVIAASPNLKIVARLGIGLDNIDVAYCTEKKIPVTNIPDYCVIEVAEHTLALLLACARKIAMYHYETQNGRYELQAGPLMRRVSGQTLGIVGLGQIGTLLAERALALGMRVIATSRSGKTMPGVETVDLERILSESDYISLLVPATAETRHMFGAEQFQKMKPTAYLINTARGALIDEAALAAAIEAGELAGAALDVQDPEPPDLSKAPMNDPRVIVTPHAAFVSVESLENLRGRATKQVVDWLEGRTPENVRNPEVLG
ncbi:C-terminal binding protein [Blastopirellula sp. JC732]|uniref:C-terminal binding protein n=1 Tax=Blastopirellula sediminis TaxID=2894196 RepID=A0A9X1MMC7_9BACT|nr:C-terminal binding protein [Blastopirellula sediminis]MCC9606942.1 C-terminal binding protein [Blastopirellula sediminis]MCC9629763.1 C-terminal binding protein [Blastopirellula sediminis]